MKSVITQFLLINKNIKNSIIRRKEFRRVFSSSVVTEALSINQCKSFVPFDQVLKNRREEAARSIIVQVKNEKSHAELLSYCISFGTANNAFYYSINNKSNYILIEFENLSSASEIIRNGQHLEENEIIPIKSSLLWFRSGIKGIKHRTDIPPLTIENNELPTEKEFQNLFYNANTFSDEMITLYNRTKLNEVGTRLRFITAMQIETAFKGLFPFGRVVPFGSSVNGFGKLGCDLDLVYEFDELLKYSPSNSEVKSRLVFHAKETNRVYSQRHLETIADIVQYLLPGCTQVKRILRARVPIIRYRQDITAIDCDLSSTNMSGVYMSELLYMYGSYDWRVRPLVFTVRYWAKEINLTNPAPGRWITNFSLSLLVLFYLQHIKLLPTFETLTKLKRPEDTRISDDIDCSFLRDLRFLPETATKKSDESLFDLFLGFFQFYSSFDFGSYALSLNTGTVIPKPEYCALYIVNPLEKYLNVSKNISPEECERLKMQFRSAAYTIECAKSDIIEKKSDKWGLINFIKDQMLNKYNILKKQGGMKSSSKNSARIAFHQLFDNDELNSKSTNNNKNETKNVKIR